MSELVSELVSTDLCQCLAHGTSHRDLWTAGRECADTCTASQLMRGDRRKQAKVSETQSRLYAKDQQQREQRITSVDSADGHKVAHRRVVVLGDVPTDHIVSLTRIESVETKD